MELPRFWGGVRPLVRRSASPPSGAVAFGSGALWVYLGSTAAFGLAAPWVAWRSGSLLWAAVLHGLNDWLGSTVFMPSSMVGLLALAVVGPRSSAPSGPRTQEQSAESAST